ncbi:hypothetical protein ACFVOO_23965 [Streptomyces rochei]|uniref:hypothetical protein n=1 Tax=Streptomyces rochei TaxID=1928 RepID=UPI0036CAADD3
MTDQPHTCTNCEGIDPATCLMNPDRSPALDTGPTVAEAAADDRRWWTDKYAGEGQ